MVTLVGVYVLSPDASLPTLTIEVYSECKANSKPLVVSSVAIGLITNASGRLPPPPPPYYLFFFFFFPFFFFLFFLGGGGRGAGRGGGDFNTFPIKRKVLEKRSDQYYWNLFAKFHLK